MSIFAQWARLACYACGPIQTNLIVYLKLQAQWTSKHCCYSESEIPTHRQRATTVNGNSPSGIQVFAFYSSNPWTDYPFLSFEKCLALLDCEVHTKTVTCPTLLIASTQWTKHSTFYIASIVIPIALLKEKHFVPTFHFCQIPCVYSQNLSVSYHALKTNLKALTASLVIQIQISDQCNSKEYRYPVPDGSGDVPSPAYSDCWVVLLILGSPHIRGFQAHLEARVWVVNVFCKPLRD